MVSISKNNIRFMLAAFYAIGILVQVLVLVKVIPYDWVNGGMSESYSAQAVQSVASLIILILMTLFTLKLSTTRARPKTWKIYLLYVMTTFWVLGFAMQLAGTNFERYVMSLALLLGITSHVLLIKYVKKSKAQAS